MSRLYLIYLAALLAATLAAPVPAAVDRDGSQAYYEQAMEFFRAAQFPEATIQLKNAVQRDPKNLAARIMLGKVLLREGQPLAAIKELEMAQAMGGDENLILVPLAQAYIDVAEHEHVITGFVAEGHLPAVDGELYILQAEAYLQLGSRKPAEEAYLSAGVLMPIDPRPILGRARMQLAKNRPKRARRLLDEALALAPESYGVWIFKAIMHRDFGEYKDAIQAFERVLELRPTSVRALTARAAMWMDLGQIEKAKADITQAAGLNNDSLETIYLRTLILFREGKAEEARQVLRASADEIRQIKEGYREKFPNTKLMLGVVAYFERNYDEAIAHLRAYLATIPQHPGALRYLASAYLSLGETQEVIRLLNPNPQTKLPNDPITLSILGEAYRSSGQFDKAESFFAAALKLAPNAAGLGVRLAMSRLDAGQAAAATDNLEKLAARFPDFKEAQIQLARVYVKTGNVERAAQVAADMAVRFRDDGEVHNVVGATFLAAGQTARARNHMRLAAELEPDLILPKLNLARLARAEGHMASAQAQYRTVLEQFPHHAIAALELTDLLLREGNHEEALDHIRRVLETDPLLFQAHELRLKAMFAKREDPEEIRTSLYDLTKTFPDEARASLVAGKGYRQLGDLADAKVQFRRTVESARFETELLFKTANQQFGIGDNSGALWSLTKAEQASPKHKGVGVLKAGGPDRARGFPCCRGNDSSAL